MTEAELALTNALNESDLQDGLIVLFDVQEIVSGLVPGCLVPTPDNIRACMLAIVEETIELGRELGSRPWHLPTYIAKEKVLEEYADILAFVGLLGNYIESLTGSGTQAITEAYAKKSVINYARLSKRFHGGSTPAEEK